MLWLIVSAFGVVVVGLVWLLLRPIKFPRREEWLGPIAKVKTPKKSNVVQVDFEGAALTRALKESIRREKESKAQRERESKE